MWTNEGGAESARERLGKIKKIRESEIIIKEGESNPEMYKIIQGHVELYTGFGTDKEVLLGILGPQTCFGEFGLLTQYPAIYTAIAFSETYVLRIPAENILELVKENQKTIIDIMRNMSLTMMKMQKQIDLLSSEIEVLEKGDESGAPKKIDKTVIKEAQRNLRAYAIANQNDRMHFLQRGF